MSKVIRKINAGIMAAALTVIGCFGSFSASASLGDAVTTTLAPVPNSAFRYKVITETTTYNGDSDCLKLTIKVVNNPRAEVMAFKVVADAGCSFVDTGAGSWQTNGNVALCNQIFSSVTAQTPDKKYEFTAYLKVNNMNANHQINVLLDAFMCKAENISSYSSESNDTTVPIGPQKGVMLGDANGNHEIDQYDAYNTMVAVDYNNGSIPVSSLNKWMSQSVWQNMLPGLYCAEVIDVNGDNYITESDYEAILKYHSNAAIGKPNTGSPIGTIYYINQ